MAKLLVEGVEQSYKINPAITYIPSGEKTSRFPIFFRKIISGSLVF
jgi:hypothetical protein